VCCWVGSRTCLTSRSTVGIAQRILALTIGMLLKTLTGRLSRALNTCDGR
jgi:hypothetical protein